MNKPTAQNQFAKLSAKTLTSFKPSSTTTLTIKPVTSTRVEAVNLFQKPKLPAEKPEISKKTETGEKRCAEQPPPEQPAPKKICVEAPKPPPPPLSMLYTLLSDTLPLNFHPKVTETVINFVRKHMEDRSVLRILAINGPIGCGKTFCVRRACRDAGFELIELNCSRTPEEFENIRMQGLFGKSDRVRVLLVDNVDELKPARLNKFFSTAATKGQRIRFKYNAVIMTHTEYVKQFTRLRNAPNRFQEVECKPLVFDQTKELIKHICTLQNCPMPDVGSLWAANGPDTGCILSQLYAHHTSGAENARLSGAKDQVSLNLKTAVDLLVRPNEIDRNQSLRWERNLSMNQKYAAIWDCGGEQLDDVLFNIYPRRLAPCLDLNSAPEFIKEIRQEKKINDDQWGTKPALEIISDDMDDDEKSKRSKANTKIMTEWQQSRYGLIGTELDDAFMREMQALECLADAYSTSNVLKRGRGKTYLQGHIFQAMKASPQNSRIQLIMPSEFRPLAVESKMARAQKVLNECFVDRSQVEILQFVGVLNAAEVAKKAKDLSYEIQDDYDWKQHIGIFHGHDVFADCQDRTSKDWKWTGKRTSELPPIGIECAKLMHGNFSVEMPVKPSK